MEIDLSTTTTSGGRKWVYPILALGRWLRRRQIVAIALITWLLFAPWFKVGGYQAVFFDLVQRKIHFLGLTFWVNELVVFLLFILFVLSSILLLTVVLGRVFCGWACPMTVFMEFVFRPIEKFFEGAGALQRNFKEKPWIERILPQSLKWILFLGVSIILGNTFVAYLMGSHRLIAMVQEGPAENWEPFLFMLISSGIILFQFGWFREQICLFVCPYGRLQSVMLDRDSLIVGYDKARGEPRGKLGHTTGDCIDCKLCVRVCPTGIDIRNGLQLECIHCTQCIDACDSIMQNIEKPLGLIRYTTEAELEGRKTKILRPRLAIYAVVLFATASLMVGYTATRKDFRATIHRETGRDVYETDPSGKIINSVRVHLTNLTENELQIRFQPEEPRNLEVISPEGVIVLKGQEKLTVHLLLKLPHEAFAAHFGLAEVEFKAIDQLGSENELEIKLIGPAQ